MATFHLAIYFTLAFVAFTAAVDPTPVVLWHGMGDTCCYPFSMGAIQDLIEKEVPDVFVHSIKIGKTVPEDEMNGFLMNANHQIEYAHKQLQAIPELKDGFNAIGFSQGGQFLRAYVQRYNNPPVRSLISVGGQHQGVFGFPHCPGGNRTLCEEVRKLLRLGAYERQVQERVVQAEYWQDPLHEDDYLAKCVFLPDINNAVSINTTYKKNFVSLDAFVMVKFTNDTMVQPRESEWFGFYEMGQDEKVLRMNETSLYLNDTIGLATLDKAGKVHFLSNPGDHLQFTNEWFVDHIIEPFLSTSNLSSS